MAKKVHNGETHINTPPVPRIVRAYPADKTSAAAQFAKRKIDNDTYMGSRFHPGTQEWLITYKMT